MTQKEANDSLALITQELNVRGTLGECGALPYYLPSLPPSLLPPPGVLTHPRFTPNTHRA